MSFFDRFRRKAPEAQAGTAVAESAVVSTEETGPADAILAASVVSLIALGVVMVYSASAILVQVLRHSPAYFLIRQSIYAALGLTAMFITAGIDYRFFRKITYLIFGVALVLLLAVAFGAGHAAGGATRWIQLGPINIQPAEVAKVAVIFWLAYSLSKKRDKLRDFSVGFLPHVLFAGVFMLLCMFQPDFGSAVMIGTITFVLLFTAGTRLGYLLGSIVMTVPVLVVLVITSEYRLKRVKAFMGLGENVAAGMYQVDQSSFAFARGGVFGVGLGDSRQKMLFLPEAHTDFISAIVGEELGLIGTGFLVITFVVIVWRAMRAAVRAADDYGTYLATGIGTFVGLQAFTNLGVAMGLLPTKGLVLPFVSYGGSSLLVNCAAIGVLLNISRPRSGSPAPEVSSIESGASDSIRRVGARAPRNVALGGGAA
jgi:cell division protein FtsW